MPANLSPAVAAALAKFKQAKAQGDAANTPPAANKGSSKPKAATNPNIKPLPPGRYFGWNPSDLAYLTGEAQEELKKQKAAAKAAAKEQRAGTIARAVAAAHSHRSEWQSTAVVFIAHSMLCRACGAEFIRPNEKLLVRFRSKITGAVWESARESGLIPPDLPRESRVFTTTVDACQECWHDTPPGQGQLFPAHEPYPTPAARSGEPEQTPLPSAAQRAFEEL